MALSWAYEAFPGVLAGFEVLSQKGFSLCIRS